MAACETEEAVEEATGALVGGGMVLHWVTCYGASLFRSEVAVCDAVINVFLFCRPGYAAPVRNESAGAHCVNACDLSCARQQQRR